ncbi:MAG: glycosyltransferase family 2 protein [Bacteroidales bacterium]|nr:glycosyltransferase family 2 protein [Bacteroidales bacterium]
MKTAVVILNWNGKDFLGKFLPGLVSSLEGFDAKVVVADNASEDGSLELLKADFPTVDTIKFQKNHGFTGGYNRAFSSLRKKYPEMEYFLLINSDIEVSPDWFYPLEEWMDLHEDCAACGPKLLSYQNREYFEYAGAAGGQLDAMGYPFCRGRVLKRVEKDSGQYDNIPADVLWASGACLCFRASAWADLKGLDERFFAHMEEIDLCWRARLAGWRVSVVPRSVVYHVGGGTLPEDSPWKLELNYRNNLLMLENNLARHEALGLLYELMAVGAEESAVGFDPVNNCRASFEDMGRKMQSVLIEEAARAGGKYARKLIRKRIFLDWCASVVYRLKGRKDYALAVKKAHAAYRELSKEPSKSAITRFLTDDFVGGSRVARAALEFDMEASRGNKVRKRCFHDGYILIEAFLKKDEIFDYLRENL